MVDNFIYFNDDYFVGNPLKKTDFFYVENGRIVPYIIAKKINKNISKSIIEQYYYDWYKFVSKRKYLTQDHIEYSLQLNTTRLFIYKLFGEDAKLLRHDHNAISDNVIEGEEIYNVVLNKYNKPEECKFECGKNKSIIF